MRPLCIQCDPGSRSSRSNIYKLDCPAAGNVSENRPQPMLTGPAGSNSTLSVLRNHTGDPARYILQPKVRPA
jgi:hypothetical protein